MWCHYISLQACQHFVTSFLPECTFFFFQFENSKRFNPTLHSMNNMQRHHIHSWSGIKFTPRNLKGGIGSFLTPALRLWGGGHIGRHVWRWVIYRLITAYLLLRVNLDKIMHARWDFDASSAQTRRVSALDKHQNWSASALFCLNSRAQSKYAVVNLIHTRRKQLFCLLLCDK